MCYHTYPMGFVTLGRAYRDMRKIMLDTPFLTEYMPLAPEVYTKVYLLGLAFSSSEDNELDGIALLLDIDRKTVTEAFLYWQSQELVRVTDDPPAVEYLPVVPVSKRIPKFEKEKYKAFNDQLHKMIKERPITPNEYNEYYTIMELTGLEVEAMLMIVGYCIRQKGADIRHQYITAVARDMVAKGFKTYERVQEHLADLELLDNDLTAVLKALKLTRKPDHADKQALLKWKKQLGFPQETIIVVAKRVKKGGMERLDGLLSRYYENRLLTIKEIDAFELSHERTNALTRELTKILGTWAERLDYVIESYVSPWLSLGFSEDALKRIADYCFRRSAKDARPFENMDHYVKQFYKQGLVSLESIYAFLQGGLLEDEKIRELLEKLGLSRPVTSQDRVNYKTWTEGWGMNAELIGYACEQSKGKEFPVAYMNSILSSWFHKKITTAAEARAQGSSAIGTATKSFDTVVMREGNPNFVSRSLTAEQLNAMFDRLGDDEL